MQNLRRALKIPQRDGRIVAVVGQLFSLLLQFAGPAGLARRVYFFVRPASRQRHEMFRIPEPVEIFNRRPPVMVILNVGDAVEPRGLAPHPFETQ